MAFTSIGPHYPKIVMFDLLTALPNSRTLWNRCAGSEKAGRAWRAEYLLLTYECGQYVSYESLLEQAAQHVGLPETALQTLEANWLGLTPWSGAFAALQQLQPHCKLAVVTNCSALLGHQAASILPVNWDAVVTAEEAGAYKPDLIADRFAVDKLGVSAADAAFVEGSSYDLFGTRAVGLRTYWHNRIGLPRVAGAKPAEFESPTLDAPASWAGHFGDAIQP